MGNLDLIPGLGRSPGEENGYPLHCSVSQSVQSVVSDSLRPPGLQHTRPPCPSPTPGVSSNSCPLSRWCHPTISSSVVPFSSCLQSFSASGSFPVSQFFASGSQSIGVSTSASVLPVNIQDWFPLGLTGLISLQSKRLSRVFSNTTVQKNHSVFLPGEFHGQRSLAGYSSWSHKELDMIERLSLSLYWGLQLLRSSERTCSKEVGEELYIYMNFFFNLGNRCSQAFVVVVVRLLSCVQLFYYIMYCSPTRLLCPWDSKTRILEQVAISLSSRSSRQGSNPCLLHWQVDSLPLTTWKVCSQAYISVKDYC